MSLPPIADLLPHRPPMLWIDEVIEQDGDEIHCRLTLRDNHVFVQDGQVEPIVAIEWMAQTVGAFVGMYDRRRDQAPRPGYLIAIPEAQFFADRFRVGDELALWARRAWGDETLGSFECRVLRAGQLVASAQLSVYRPHPNAGPLPGSAAVSLPGGTASGVRS